MSSATQDRSAYNLFYYNRRLLMLAVSLIFVIGLSSAMVLPRMEDPLLTPRAANIITLVPGADASRVEALVTEKLEDELSEIEQIKEMRSNSRAGISILVIELRDDVYADEARGVWSRIRDKVNDARPLLDKDALDPEFEELDIKAYAMLNGLVWKSDQPVNYAVLRRLSEELKDILESVSGTQEVDLYGDPQEEIQVELDAELLISMGLTAQDVANAIAASDAKVSAGQLRAESDDYLIEVSGKLDTLGQISAIPLPLAPSNSSRPSQAGAANAQAQIGDIATIHKGIRNPPSSVTIQNGDRTVVLGTLVRDNYRIDLWTERVQDELDKYARQLPKGIELVTIFEQNRYVSSRLNNLLFNLLLGGGAVFIVILVMMGWRNAIIVASALPLAAFMVLGGLRFLEIPVHQMSVTGLIIALGLLIDNAIVITDDVTMKLREGSSPGRAVSASVKHLMVPLFGSTLTTALAFGPIALMPGPAGEFVGSIAISVILAIFSSFILAMTIIPALTAIFSPLKNVHGDNRESTAGNRDASSTRWWQYGLTIPVLTSWYRRSLDFVFKRPWLGIGIGVVLPIFGFIQSRHLSEQFFPPADRDQIHIEFELAPTASMQQTLETARNIDVSLIELGNIESVTWFLGESAPPFYYNLIKKNQNMPSYAQAIVNLNNGEDLESTIHQIQAELDIQFPQARILVRQLEQGPPFDAPIEVRLFGPDLNTLQNMGEEVREILAGTPGVIHTRSELSETRAKVRFDVDQQQAQIAGLSHVGIANQLNATLEGALGGTVLEATEELPVRVRVSDKRRGSLSQIASLDLLANGDLNSQGDSLGSEYRGVPIGAIAQETLIPEVTSIPHLAGRRMNEIKAYIPAGVLPSTVLVPFQKRLEASGLELPPGYSISYGGEAAKRDEAIGNLMANVGVLAVLMAATLVLSFGSFRVASLIGIVAALSVGLGFAALWAWDFPFGFMAIVGTMGLIGVAINDTIVVIAAIGENKDARKGDPDAIREVVARASRHIVSTTLTTIAGFTPLVIAGGGFWPPLAVSIAGGVAGATILALYFAPSCYIVMMRRKQNSEPSHGGQSRTSANRVPQCSRVQRHSSQVEVAATSASR
jgi:multidrug efflux pump subunit AcrB